MIRVMIRHPARRWIVLLALAGVARIGSPAAAQTGAPMEFPPVGSRWITRSIDPAGGNRLTTYTVLEPGAFRGQPGFRVSDGVGVQLFEPAGRNWFATVVREKERAGATPHTGAFAWPLEVGKTWASTYQYRDHLRNLRVNRVVTTWRVVAEEEITVPAGTFKALRLEGSNNGNAWTIWYAPLLRLVLKEIHERKPTHPFGPGHTVTEVVRHTGPGGDPWYGFGLEASQAVVRRGDGRRALAFYESAAKDFEARGMPIEAAQALIDVARVGRFVGAVQQGLRGGLRAIELLKAAPRDDETLGNLANAYLFTGFLYRSAGSLAETQGFLQEGAQLPPAFSTAQRRLYWAGAFARALADLAYARHDFPAAAQQAAESVRQFEQFLANQSSSTFDQGRRNAQRNLTLALGVVGDAERHLGNHVAAAQALHRRVQVARDLGAPELELGARNSLGYLALSQRDTAEAVRQFEESRRIAAATGSPTFVMWAHNGIGRARFQEGRYPEALNAYKEAIAVAEGLRGSLQDAALRSGFLEDKQEMYHGAVWSAVALRRAEEAWGLAERARSRAFLDLLGTQTVLSKGKTRALVDEEVRLRARLSAARTAVEEASEEDAADARAEAEAADRAYREFLDRVRKESVEQASLMSVEPVNAPELQALLPEGTTLVEYLVSRNGTFAWAITRSSVTVVRINVPREQIVAEVRAFRQGIEGQAPLPDAQKLAETLHERLVAPVRGHIKGTRVVVVPHDVLHYLPFGALRSKTGRWLVEDYTLSTLPSASVLKFLEGKRTASGGGGVLAVGNPDLGSALNLRYAEREARVVGDHYAGASVLLRQEATETRAKALADSARLLHFATHGELNERDPLASGLLLTPGGGNDGRLEVREIFGLDLKAQLVVLSACETGLGQLSTGDELVGLQRAFLYAGSPAVVTTLWKVDDRASFALMREFYDRLPKADAGQALQAAQRAVMKEFPHPFAWAAFGLTGVGR
jgi:CHAT domain-containing protein